MERKNEHTLKVYELHEKGFVATIKINRSEMKWSFRITDANNKTIAYERNIHFMSESEISLRMSATINDCIANPEEYL